MVGELPIVRKNRQLSLSEKRMKGSKEIAHESSQLGPFENLSIGDRMSDPDWFDTSCDDGSASISGSPDALSEHLPFRSTGGSSPLSPESPSLRGDCVDRRDSGDSFGGSATHQMLLKKRKEKNLSSTSFDSKDECRPSRWGSGRWSGGKPSFEEGSPERLSPRNSAFKCAAGLTADVAVVCCCPLSLLHLLTIALFKFPNAVVSKTVRAVKRKVAAKRKRAAAHHEEEEESASSASFPPSRCRSYESGRTQIWSPMLAFRDEEIWKDCNNFDSSDTDGEPLRGKS